jgi:hypothetical protein
MKPDHTIKRAIAILAVALLANCGTDTKTGSNGTGTSPLTRSFLSAGTLIGVDPYSVADTALTTGATVFRVDEAAGSSAADIRLGMNVEAQGTPTSTDSADLNIVATQSAASGPVITVDAAGRFTVASLTFVIDGNTLYDGVAGFAALSPGMYVQVSGLPLADLRTLLATRVTRMTAPADGHISVAGRVEGLTAQGITFAGLTIPALQSSATSLSVGDRIRVTGPFDAQASAFTTEQVVVLTKYAPAADTRVELEGIALDAASVGGGFRLRTPARDYDVAAGPATSIPFASGSRVRVVATATSATALVPISVTPVSAISYSVSGTVSDFVSLASLRVRGEPADLTMAVIHGGTAADVANGRRVVINSAVGGPGALRVMDATLQP